MNSSLTLAPDGNRDLWSSAQATSDEAPRRRYSPVALLEIVASWRRRTYCRRELKQLLRDCPELIDDVGLTRRDVETEIGKTFWQR